MFEELIRLSIIKRLYLRFACFNNNIILLFDIRIGNILRDIDNDDEDEDDISKQKQQRYTIDVIGNRVPKINWKFRINQ